MHEKTTYASRVNAKTAEMRKIVDDIDDEDDDIDTKDEDGIVKDDPQFTLAITRGITVFVSNYSSCYVGRRQMSPWSQFTIPLLIFWGRAGGYLPAFTTHDLWDATTFNLHDGNENEWVQSLLVITIHLVPFNLVIFFQIGMLRKKIFQISLQRREKCF